MNGSYFALWLLAVLSTSLISNLEGVSYRLDGSVLPSFYNLTLFVESDYQGLVEITLKTQQENVRIIKLHQDTLKITDIRLNDIAGNMVENILPEQLEYEEETQQFSVPLGTELLRNVDYILKIRFEGTIRTDMAGLFSASYVDELTNSTNWLALTQMQRLNARLVFPCFDEPSIKARFQLQIIRTVGYNAITNTRLITSTPFV